MQPDSLTDAKVLLVEDDPLARRLLAAQLAAARCHLVEVDGGRAALAAADDSFDAVCLDLGLADMGGLDVLAHLTHASPELPVIVVTANDRAEDAVAAIRQGAYDYLVKPVDELRLRSSLQRAVERRQLMRQLRERTAGDEPLFGRMIGKSRAMQSLATKVERVLSSDVSVAIFGESGTGKELVARTLHDAGHRRQGPFVALNCAAIPENLLESELFGHEKGAFTGAMAEHRGRFEQAHGGTLFLDEIGEMSPGVQASLLRTLQEGTVRRVGGTREIRVDVRVVCATHRALLDAVEDGSFRADLYYRLVVYPIDLPSLRERADDIPLLVHHFLAQFDRAPEAERKRVHADALEALVRYRWPGNVRELQNVVQRALLSCDGATITTEHLPPVVLGRQLPALPASPAAPASPGVAEEPIVPLQLIEQRAIRRALEHTRGSVGKAAKLLGIGRATLYRRLASDPALQELGAS